MMYRFPIFSLQCGPLKKKTEIAVVRVGSNINSNVFKTSFSTLAKELENRLPDPPYKFGTESVKKYYKHLKLERKRSHYIMQLMKMFLHFWRE